MPRSIDPAIGQRIARAREDRGVMQASLAAAIGVKPQQISRFENGKASPSAEQLRGIGEALACSVDSLLALESSTPRLLHQIRAAVDALEVNTAEPGSGRPTGPAAPATPPAS